MEVNQQLADLKANSRSFTSCSMREVQGGYVVTGQIQYQDKDTKGIVLSQNDEGVAADARTAVGMSSNYLTTGTFDGASQQASQQPSLFGTANGLPAATAAQNTI